MLCRVVAQMQHPLSHDYSWESGVMRENTVIKLKMVLVLITSWMVHKQQDPSESHEEAGDAEAAASPWDLVPEPQASTPTECSLTTQICLVIW